MGSYKKINLTEDKLKEIIQELESQKGIKVTNKQQGDGSIQLQITIPGQKPALLRIWFKPDGATIQYKLGKNQELSKQIADRIVELAGKLEDVAKSFEGITSELLDELLFSLEDLGMQILKEKKTNETLFILTWHSGQKLTMHYYPSTCKLFVQGKKNRIFDEITIWYANCKSETVEEAIKLIFSSFSEIEKTIEEFPDSILESKVREKITSAYDKLDQAEKKWIKTSVYMLALHKDLPDFYPAVSGILKLSEGVLKRIFVRRRLFRFEDKRKEFVHFNKRNNRYFLKTDYQSVFESYQIPIVEEAYNFIVDNRHKFQHAQFMASPELSREDAQNILDGICGLLRKLNGTGLL
ncbi:type II toxin-antitoxin system RnlA family toxin [Desulfurobacterium atlanticum]|uniref:RNase LS, toxin n=1 Tax=Desulfurobacterium atlanticum TaxID=240169 RepID=A0A238Y5X9_9BACT|nr:type II toxin-antitoxin system RnlA family toxin [Desulfurobacterium atlanticum]SNR66420.1 RNase LS, toxin [Desulfurobacterium atlanticum]